MDALLVEGPTKLKGTVEVSGSKNTALPFLFMSLLFDQEIEFTNVPRLWDIETTLKILELMGCTSSWEKDEGRIRILPRVENRVAPYEWVKKMRAGILALGPLVARYGEARVSLPGGCAIGARPVNYHIEAMREMGVKVAVEEGYIHAEVPGRLTGAEIRFPQVTVTGTENLLILAAMAEGTTTLENAAQEPEVVAVGEWLKSAGAEIEGLGTPFITVKGGKLSPPKAPVVIPPDRIEAGTWISASVATKSPLTIKKVDARHLRAVIAAYRDMGAEIEISPDHQELRVTPAEKPQAIAIETQPYPGFATDMQAQILANACLAHGTSRISETIFENRFMHVAELRRLGAKIEVVGHTAIVEGPVTFEGAPIMATDLRASASLVVAALCARGQTKISRIYHLDRGYSRLDEKLRALGARITRVAD